MPLFPRTCLCSFVALLLLCAGLALGATPASYTGANGNWNVGTNWSTSPTVPLNGGVNAYDVTISGNTVTYNIPGNNAVQSLALSSSTLNLNSGDSLSLVGGLTATNSTINPQGAAFSAGGAASVNGSTLSVSSGGSISLPGLTTFSTAAGGGTIQVSGSTSQMTLAYFATLALGGNGFTASAQNAGNLQLNALTSITSTGSIFEGTTFSASGTSSALHANGLTSLTMNGASITLQAQSGGYAEMTSLATINNSGSIFGNFNGYADGTNSKISLPALTTINLNGATDTLRATAGGDFEAPLLASVTSTGNIFEQLYLQASGAGSLFNAPLLGNAPLSRVSVTVQSGGNFHWGSPTTVTASSLTLDTSGTLNTASLTDIDSTSLTATNGATFSIPVTAFSTALGSATWQATNAASKLTLPNLTSIALSGNNLTVQAQNGGDVELPAVTSITPGTSTLSLTTSGTGSLINLPEAPATLSQIAVSLSGGSVQWGSPTSLMSSSVSITTAGTVNLSALTNVNSTSFTAAGGVSLTVPLVTTYATNGSTSATETANAGSTLTFPLLVSVSNPGGSIFGNFNLTASGTGAKLSMPALATMTVNGEGDTIAASGGGDVELPALVNLNNSASTFDAFNLQVSGAGSLFNAPLLGTTPLVRVNVSLNGGTIAWGNPTVMQAGSVTIDTSGTIALTQLTNIDSTGFNAANGVTITLPNVLAISVVSGTGATLQATGANSTLSLPNVQSLNNLPGNVFSSVTVSASGSGCTTLLPALQSVTTGGASVTFQASAGGQVLANAIKTVASSGSIFGNFNVSADGTGSKVSMTSLSVMHMNVATNSITASNGGDVELPAVTSITATGSIFESFNVSSTGAGSLVNLSGLLSTAAIPNSLSLANNGELDLGGRAIPFTISFLANFATGSTGTLDVYLNQTLLDSIAPNNAGTYMPYVLNVGTSQPGASDVRFIADGAGAQVTVENYLAPEPGTVGLLSVVAFRLLLRRQRPVTRIDWSV